MLSLLAMTQVKTSHPITKSRLFLRAMLMPFFAGGALALVFFISMTVLIMGDGTYTLFDLLTTLGFFSTLIFLNFCFTGMFIPVRGIILINKQESALDFSFNEEMKNREVSNYDFADKDYFISLKSDRVVVLRRDFIARLEDMREENRMLSRITVIDATGKQHKVTGHAESIDALQTWFDAP